MTFPLPTTSSRAWFTRPFAFITVLVLVIGGVGSAFSSQTLAKRIPRTTEEMISAAAIQALTVLNEFINSGDRDKFDLYRLYANQLAIPISVALNLDVNELQRSWANADIPHQRALMAGLTQLGVPYRLNTSIAFTSFDCSGLTSYAWGVAGIAMGRSSSAQYYRATQVKLTQAQPGDLVWRPGHVSMYLGVPGAVLQAPDRGRNVEIQLMNERISGWVRYADPIE